MVLQQYRIVIRSTWQKIISGSQNAWSAVGGAQIDLHESRAAESDGKAKSKCRSSVVKIDPAALSATRQGSVLFFSTHSSK